MTSDVATVEPDAGKSPVPELYKVRVLLGSPQGGGAGNIWHLLCARAPDRLHVDSEGCVDFRPWEPLDRPDASDRVLFLAASCVAGVSYRIAASPKQIAQALGEKLPDPEDAADPATLIACLNCGEKNIPRRRGCRKCGANMGPAKPRVRRTRKAAPAEGDASAKPPRKRRDRTGQVEISQCPHCGSAFDRRESKKRGRCPQCAKML